MNSMQKAIRFAAQHFEAVKINVIWLQKRACTSTPATMYAHQTKQSMQIQTISIFRNVFFFPFFFSFLSQETKEKTHSE